MNDTLLNILSNTRAEKWHEYNINILACSACARGVVNSFTAKYKGRKYYGYRKDGKLILG